MQLVHAKFDLVKLIIALNGSKIHFIENSLSKWLKLQFGQLNRKWNSLLSIERHKWMKDRRASFPSTYTFDFARSHSEWFFFHCIFVLSICFYIDAHLYYKPYTHKQSHEYYIKIHCQALSLWFSPLLICTPNSSFQRYTCVVYVYKTKPFPFTNSPIRHLLSVFFFSLVFSIPLQTKSWRFLKSTWMLRLYMFLLSFF